MDRLLAQRQQFSEAPEVPALRSVHVPPTGGMTRTVS
jgi:hypothetical protein